MLCVITGYPTWRVFSWTSKYKSSQFNEACMNIVMQREPQIWNRLPRVFSIVECLFFW
ncbi:Hypothetical predicted protein [Podarcis lilfordi]|uniref:Uncharacterized protein n=1 Tax=Podarcis lilfordi TaxID=74358 RepID=A0AA35K196_9SAUR|nr:Hypothetical predicted protein [Podarcis lilfordi]